jgi:predicted Zn-ribbon and HTH transcriptional regulator
VIHASPLSEACIPVAPSREFASAYEVGNYIGFPSRCPLCSSNSSNNRAKVGFKRRLQRLLGEWLREV